ncbi:MAG: hemerythrin family protein [Deltaproteobacteria bacterium]
MLTWSPSFAIGVPEIDDQHRTLFERAGRFAAAVHGHERSARLAELFDFLSEYALEHFASEERLMRSVDYPDIERHAVEHRSFRGRLGSLAPQWDSEGESSAMLLALLGFLDAWLTEHVRGSDQRLAIFLRARRPVR